MNTKVNTNKGKMGQPTGLGNVPQGGNPDTDPRASKLMFGKPDSLNGTRGRKTWVNPGK